MNGFVSRIFRAGAVLAGVGICILPQTSAGFALGAKETIDLRGNSITSDSFNSADPLYSTDGRYDPAKNRDHGDLVVMGGFTNSLSIGNARIMGHVKTGQETITLGIGPNGSVGEKAWVESGNRGIEPGWWSTDADEVWPDVALPAANWLPAIPGSYNIDGTIYEYVFQANGYYAINSVSGSIFVGNNVSVRLKISGNASVQAIRIGTNGTLSMFIQGASFTAHQPIENANGNAASCRLYGLPGNTTIDITASFTGTIYAPEAAVVLGGGGSAASEFVGTCVGRTVAINGHVNVHYDENLMPISMAPPSIGLQPQDQNVLAGGNATFTVSARGSGLFGYQWRFNGGSIPSATSSSLAITSASSQHAGVYSAVITNAYGSVTSSNATLTVNFPPSILQQPVSQVALVNSNVMFQVKAGGTATLAYQWKWNGQHISGATDAALSIDAMQSSNAGTYLVVVTNAFGTATSAPVTLSVGSPPDFLWVRDAPGKVDERSGQTRPVHMAVDGAGNVLVVGDYEGWGIDFGGGTLTNSSWNPSFASFVCKYDRWGNFVWVRQLYAISDGTYRDPGLRVAADLEGNVYVTGDFTNRVTIGTNELVNTGPGDVFIAKYDPEGNFIWVRQIGAYDPSFYAGWRRGFAVDGFGNSYLLSSYAGAARLGEVVVSNSPSFLAKYNTSGTLLWARPAVNGKAIALGSSGAVYVAAEGTNVSSYSAAIVKYDQTGALVWSRPFPSAYGITVDAEDNVYTTGTGNGTCGEATLTNTGGYSDLFVAKCDSAGHLVWLRQLGNPSHFSGLGIALDACGNVYFNAGQMDALQVASLRFGSTQLTNFACWTGKYDSTGNALWARALPGWKGVKFAGNSAGTVYVGGTYLASADIGSFHLTGPNSLSETLYLARLAAIEPPGLPQIVGQPLDQVVQAGTSALFNVTVPSGIPLSYQWSFNQANTVAGGNSASLVLTNVQTSDSGAYAVVVSNMYGSVTSSPANLTVYLTDAATLSQPILSAGNQIQFAIEGVSGFQYAVAASTNLVDWVPVETNIAPFIFSDSATGNFPERFYRAIRVQ